MKRITAIRLLLNRKLASDKEHAELLISERRCSIDGKIVLNPASQVSENSQVKISEVKAVSRASEKLRSALDGFGLSVAGKICADLGSSTGGFTELLLERGATRVYAVDTAKGELAWKLRQDDRVEVWEGRNAAKIESFPEPVTLITIDISLMPLRDILPAAFKLLESTGTVLALIKPQYELPSNLVPKGGVIDDVALQRQSCESVCNLSEELGFNIQGLMRSTLKGRSGNQEYSLFLVKS